MTSRRLAFSFVLDPARFDGGLGPEDDDAARLSELLSDRLAPRLARRDPTIPKNRPSLPFENLRQHHGLGAIFAGVADEDVAHGSSTHGPDDALPFFAWARLSLTLPQMAGRP